MRRIHWRGSALFLVLLALGGCQSGSATDENPPLPTSRDEAAAVLISADVAAPWDDVANAMQPKFDLATGDAAMKKGVLPATAEIQEQVLNAFNLSAALSAAYGGAGSKAPSSPSNGAASPLTLPPIQKPTEPIGVDPALQYQAALALFQQVQLMNAQLQRIEHDNKYVAYLVQLRLTVMPYRRDLPYDLHTQISFFVEPGPSNGISSGVETKEQTAGKTDSTRLICQPKFKKPPHVIPLLATDDLERALTSEAAETARQIGLGLAAAFHGVGAGLQTTNTRQEAKAVEGQDINSLFTVGRLSDNTIYVRIGAANQPSENGKLSLIGKNYDVSVIVLFPRVYFDEECLAGKPMRFDILGRSEFRNATTGRPLNHRPRSVLIDQIDEAMRGALYSSGQLPAWQNTPNTAKRAIGDYLLNAVEDNDLGKFSRHLHRVCLAQTAGAQPRFDIKDEDCVDGQSLAVIDPDFSMAIWNSLSALLGDFSFVEATIELIPPKGIVPPINREVLLVDNGKGGAQVQLTGVSGPADHWLSATLFLRAAGRNASVYPFAAQSLKLDPTTEVLTIQFASPTQLGLTKIDPTSYLELDYTHSSPCGETDKGAKAEPYCHALSKFPVVMLHSSATEAKEPGLSFTAKTDTVVAVHGEGKVTVTIAKLKDASAKISVAGAEYSSAVDGSGKTVAGPNQDLVVKQNSTITYALRNLKSGATFTITADGQDAAGASTGSHALKFVVAK